MQNNDRLMYSALPDRPLVTWPEGKKVAFWHAPNVEHYDFIQPGGGSPSGRLPSPDPQFYMHRDYGNRVAFWRMLRACDEFDMPATTSLSLALLEEQPELREAMFERNWEIMSHGISNLRPLYGYTQEQEDEFFALSQELSKTYYGGRTIKGMLGPRISGTDNTCDLMVKHGMTYHGDWVHDEHPRPIRTESGGKLVSVPYTFMSNDVPILFTRNHHAEYYVELIKAQIDRMLRDAENDGQGRVACIATHPYVFGQPHNIKYLKEIFDYVRSDDRIWVTTAGEISDHFIDNFYDEQVSYADRLLADWTAR